MNVQYLSTESILPYDKNPRNNTKSVEVVCRSITEYGWQQPIVVDKDLIIIVGHTRHQAAQQLGLTEVPVLIADNLSEEQARAYRIMDNRSGEFSDWDNTLLIDELTDLLDNVDDLDITGFTERDLFEMTHDDDNPYTQKIESPIYEPHGVKPDISETYDSAFAEQLLAEIDSESDLTPEERQLLTLAAYRHVKLDFENIAEYYCHSSDACKRLMERSAMIIIDFEQAIELGYVKLSNDLAEAYAQDFPDE